MICLAMDTSGPYASVAVLEDERILCEFVLDAGRTHSETLMPLVDLALTKGDLSPDRIDLFAVTLGPGSFTGIRIGVLTVKALAHAVEKPCAGISTLEALAEGAGPFDGLVAPMLDARRDHVYAAAFLYDGRRLRLLEDEAQSVSEFLDKLPEDRRLYFTGDGALKHGDMIRSRFGSRANIAPLHASFPRAAAVGALALKNPEIWTDYAHLLPVYLKGSQAEREREARDERP